MKSKIELKRFDLLMEYVDQLLQEFSTGQILEWADSAGLNTTSELAVFLNVQMRSGERAQKKIDEILYGGRK